MDPKMHDMEEEHLGEDEGKFSGSEAGEDFVAIPSGVANLLKEDYRDQLPLVEPEPPMVKVIGSVTEGTGIALPTQIQHIIGRELDNPGLLTRLDLQSLPTQQYLEKTVIPIVMQGMVALCKERSPDPIEYMAAYLLRHREKFKA